MSSIKKLLVFAFVFAFNSNVQSITPREFFNKVESAATFARGHVNSASERAKGVFQALFARPFPASTRDLGFDYQFRTVGSEDITTSLGQLDINNGSKLAEIIGVVKAAFSSPGLARELYDYCQTIRNDQDWSRVDASINALTKDQVLERVKRFGIRWVTCMTVVFIAKVIANDGKAMARVYDRKKPKKYSSMNVFQVAYVYSKMFVKTMLGQDVNGYFKVGALAVSVA